MTVVLAIIPAIVATSVVSGIFGMGGGMILMGLFAALLPVASAMVLHGVTQLAANGYRAYLLAGHCYWRVLGWFAVGGAIALAGMTALAVTADRNTLFLVLGGVPLGVALLPRAWAPSIESKPVALIAGAVVMAAQLVAGASGPLLDMLFIKGGLTRYQVIATKAVVSAAGHVVKLLYWAVLVPGTDIDVPLWLYPVAIAMAFAGTRMGAAILARMTDDGFRRLSTGLVAAISITFVLRGAWGLV